MQDLTGKTFVAVLQGSQMRIFTGMWPRATCAFRSQSRKFMKRTHPCDKTGPARRPLNTKRDD